MSDPMTNGSSTVPSSVDSVVVSPSVDSVVVSDVSVSSPSPPDWPMQPASVNPVAIPALLVTNVRLFIVLLWVHSPRGFTPFDSSQK
jgi:hypothetical protein